MTLKDFINERGRVSSTKTTEKWVSKNFPEQFKLIKILVKKIGLKNCTFSEEIYHFLNGAKSPILCKNCGEKKSKFSGLSLGYLDYCSSKCSNSSQEVRAKKNKSYQERYGVDNPSKNKSVVEKIQQTFQERYGGNPFTVPSFRERIKMTNIEKYGTECQFNRDSPYRKLLDSKCLENFLEKYSDFEVVNFESDKKGSARLKCKKCLNVFEISKWNLHQRTKNLMENPCTICNPIGKNQNSGIQEFIKKCLEQSGLEFIEKDRTILQGKEIDFYVPSKSIGIEVNGIYWHSDRFKEPNYHQEKSDRALEKGVKLIQIYEDEIIQKPNLVKNRLFSIFGINAKKIHARKCEIKEVDKKLAGFFLEQNHLQGKIGAKIYLGLYHNGVLVSIMTFGHLRKNLGFARKDGHWELLRFCNMLGYNIIGGASKLLKHFIDKHQPSLIISYCDRRWSSGGFYKKIGFELNGTTKPNYFYVKNKIRENRFKYRKDVLVKEGYDLEQSESSIMRDRGFSRIYDCGSYRFIMTL